MASSLFIYMNGHEVGEYIRRSGGIHELVYNASWLELSEAPSQISKDIKIPHKTIFDVLNRTSSIPARSTGSASKPPPPRN